jgi:hypothetical protein
MNPRKPSKLMSLEEEVVLLSFLDKNINVFAWSTFDLIRVSRNIIEHKLQVNLAVKLSHPVVRPKLVVHHMYAQCQGYIPRVYDRYDSVDPWGIGIGPCYNKMAVG